MREIRLQVPSSVAAACHYASQIAGCTVQEAYAVILFTAVGRMTQEEASQWVVTGLPLYRAAIAANTLSHVQKGG